MHNNRRCWHAFIEGLGKELITVLKRQCADLHLSSQPGKQTKIPTKCTETLKLYLSTVQPHLAWSGIPALRRISKLLRNVYKGWFALKIGTTVTKTCSTLQTFQH